jgi:hypothetical protein
VSKLRVAADEDFEHGEVHNVHAVGQAAEEQEPAPLVEGPNGGCNDTNIIVFQQHSTVPSFRTGPAWWVMVFSPYV